MKNDLSQLDQFFNRELYLLQTQSLIRRFFLWGKNKKIFLLKNAFTYIDDNVMQLEGNPFGMYIYNLRALFMLLGGICLLILTITAFILNWFNFNKVKLTMLLLWLSLLIVLGITLSLHRNFQKLLTTGERNNKYYILFNKYFLIDGFIVLFILIFGKYLLGLYVDTLVFWIVANLLIYCSYIAGEAFNEVSKTKFMGMVIGSTVFISTAIAWFILQSIPRAYNFEPHLFYLVLYWGPIVSCVWIAILSTGVLSHYLKIEQNTYENYLDQIVSIISSAAGLISNEAFNGKEIEIVKTGMTHILKQICNTNKNFRYKSAKLWDISEIQINFDAKGIEGEPILVANYPVTESFLSKEEIIEVLINSEDIYTFPPLAVETIYIKRKQREKITHLLELHREGALILTKQEKHFLSSMSQTIYFLDQLFRTRELSIALRDLDNILTYTNFYEACRKVLQILQKYLAAQASMLLIKQKNSDELVLIASDGLDEEIIKRNKYSINHGLTGYCMSTGKLKRIDNVEKERDKFDPVLLDNIEQALRSKLTSWMAIPLLDGPSNPGLVKVLNKANGKGNFFSEQDEMLGQRLAIKLHAVLDNSIHLEEAQQAREQAIETAKAASRSKEEAEEAATERQTDLIVLAHQLQAPLTAAIGRISLVRESNEISKWTKNHLDFTNDLLLDSIDLIYGILTASSFEANNKSYFRSDKVIVAQAAQTIVERVKRTANRPDLKFEYTETEDFPVLLLDNNVFRSVFYSLIHNATKYADRGSTIVVEAGYEWPLYDKSKKQPAIKVKSSGPPILLSEREIIFNRFYRGANVRNTGKFNKGIGLGLWIAKKLMVEVGGDITLELSPKNERLSVFVLTFGGE